MKPWSLPHRIGFRFLFAYLMLYTTSLLGLSGWIVPLIGRTAFGLDVKPGMNGSGDTSYGWVQAFSVLAFAVAVTIIWSILDRARPDCRTLHRWLRPWLRYVLGMTLIGYGMAKIVQTQFPHPGSPRLLRTFGESSPMGLLWTFMGFSAGYNLFAGLAEFVPGVLLFFRRTALLGALLAAAVMPNIVALNFFYDVPVKIFSVHLLFIAIVIAAPDAPRLACLFWLNRSALPADLSPAPAHPRLVNLWQFAKVGILVILIGLNGRRALDNQEDIAMARLNQIPHGSYRVESAPADLRWKEVEFDARPDGMVAIIRMNDGASARYGYSGSGSRVMLTPDGGIAGVGWLIQHQAGGTMQMTGTPAGQRVKVQLRRVRTGFLLEDRGFHWVSEMPFNR